MGNFKLDLNLCPGFSGRSESCFIEIAAHRIGLTFAQRAHLFVQRLRAFAKTVADFFDGILLIDSKIQIASKGTERSEAVGRCSGCSRATTKAKAWRRCRRRPLRLLRKHYYGGGGEQNRSANCSHA